MVVSKMSYALQNVKGGDALKMFLQKMENFTHSLQLQIAWIYVCQYQAVWQLTYGQIHVHYM